MVTRRLLLVEDNPEFRTALTDALTNDGIAVDQAESLAEARALVASNVYPVIVLDQELPDGNGIDLLRELAAEGEPPQVLVVASVGDVPRAVEALRLGALDYLVKTFSLGEFRLRLDRAFDKASLARDATIRGRNVAADDPELLMAGRSALMRQLREDVARFAAADSSPALILGETGSGKERVARAMHGLSPRANGPFVALNCATFDGTLLDSELFGHEKGSFTGAQARKLGLLELAGGAHCSSAKWARCLRSRKRSCCARWKRGASAAPAARRK